MPILRFLKNCPSLDVESGVNLMEALLAAGIPVASSCSGDGVCAKCRIEVIASEKDALSPENEREKFLRERHSIPKNERISCQTCVFGDVTLATGYW